MADRNFLHVFAAFTVAFCFLMFAGYPVEVLAQEVQGTVTDAESGDPLPGVNVVVQGTTTGATTNTDGEYEITVPSDDAVLEFTFIGYTRQEIPVEGRSEINVALEESVSELDELVVVGYGTQRRETLTGSVADVEGAELENSPTVSLSNTMAGRLPGVSALNRSGEPGDDISDLLIRGRNTLGNNDPLVVIDGVAGRGGLDQIDPQDVESVSILKDASGAIYGAQAANGVILIETKRGAIGEPTISFNSEVAVNQPTRIPEMADGASYAELYNDILAARNEEPRFSEDEIQAMREGTDPVNYPNTDWVDETLKDYSTQTQYGLSVSGGGERVRYYLSGNMDHQNSIFENGITNYESWGLRANVDVSATEIIELSLDVSMNTDDRTRPSVSTGTIINSMWRNYPFLPARYENGLPGAGIERGENPVVMVTDETGYRDDEGYLYQTKLGANIDIPQVEGVSVDGYFSFDRYVGNSTRWRKPWTVYDYNSNTDTYEERVGGPVSRPDLRKTSENDLDWTANARLSYQNQFDDHYVNSFIAFEHNRDYYETFYAEREEFVSEELDQLFAGSSSNQVAYGTSRQVNRSNVIGRVSYNYMEKYLIDANFRYDGSSIFPEGKRWGFFPGISASWRISEENFMQSEWVNDLRIRSSWAKLGNDRVPANQHLAAYDFTTGAFFGPDQSPNTGLEAEVAPNPNITWEEDRTVNIGVDAEFWEGKLGFTVEAFETVRSNILTSRNASIPAYTALNLPDENIGVVENKGIEAEVSHRQSGDNFHFTASANLAYARNEVVDIDEPADIPDYQRQEGKPINSRLLYLSDGIFMSEEEIENYPSISGTRPGDLRLQDVNGDGAIDSRDRVRIDSSPTPEVNFGLNIAGGYKNIDASILLQGATRAHQYFQLQTGLSGNILQEIADHRYTEDNPNPKYPNVIEDGSGFNTYASDFWYLDASFVRLKEMNISYSLPESIYSSVGMEAIRVYVSGRNLLTFAHRDWFDPEGLGGTEHRRNFYPPNRTISLGIKVDI